MVPIVRRLSLWIIFIHRRASCVKCARVRLFVLAGSYWGDSALTSLLPYGCTVVAREPSVVLALRRHKLSFVLDKLPLVCDALPMADGRAPQIITQEKAKCEEKQFMARAMSGRTNHFVYLLGSFCFHFPSTVLGACACLSTQHRFIATSKPPKARDVDRYCAVSLSGAARRV
eukprot:6193243-Pleurochrysis_carterae.AAC.2